MNKYVFEGPRTFYRVSDENGKAVAFFGGESWYEAEHRARLFMGAEERIQTLEKLRKADQEWVANLARTVLGKEAFTLYELQTTIEQMMAVNLRLTSVVEKFNTYQLEAREIFQQSHDDEEVDTGDAIQFIGRVAGTEEGWKAEDHNEPNKD